MDSHEEFLKRVQRIDELVCQLERSTDPSAAMARDLAQSLVALHGAGLARVLALFRQAGEPGRVLLEGCLADDLVRSLLMLHDLHPVDLETRVRHALDGVLPLVRSYGRELALVSVEARVVRLRFDGPDESPVSTAGILQPAVEMAILDVAPDVATIEFETADQSARRFSLPIITLPTVRA
jgi:hypothetical protein